MVSYYEVYNDLVHDLLAAASTAAIASSGCAGSSAKEKENRPAGGKAGGGRGATGKQQKQQQQQQGAKEAKKAECALAAGILKIREDVRGRVCIPGLSEVRRFEACDVQLLCS